MKPLGCESVIWAADGSGAAMPSSWEVLHGHGIWLPYMVGLSKSARAARKPVIISPRGMLEPWSLRHKRWKKRLAWGLYQRRVLASAACLHATAEAEAENIARLKLGVPVCVIPNGVEVPPAVPWQNDPPANGNPRRALFLSRIHPKKGLPLLIEAWRRVRPEGWVMEIAGPDEAGHRAEVEALIQKAGLQNAFRFLGPVSDGDKDAVFAGVDLFILPTYSENFGMVIAEALARSVPVLTTTGTPWPMLEPRDCGWWVSPTQEGITDGLARATAVGSTALRRMGENGRALVSREFGWESAGESMLDVYRWLLGNGTRPACVIS